MLRSSRQSVAAGHRVAPAVTTYKRDLAADPLQEHGGIIVDTIVAQTRQLDRFLAPLLPPTHVARTRREFAAALLVYVAEPNRSNAPATTLMLNRN